MASSNGNSASNPPPAEYFATTHWTVVISAGGKGTRSQEALELLCQTYWYPLYAYVRRQGHNAHDAQDLTQEFFARFLDKNYLTSVDRTKGKFRSFLLACIKHFLANEWHRARAQKRGGGERKISLDEAAAEGRYSFEPKDESSADRIFERRWALTLLDEVLSKLKKEFRDVGKEEQFEHLKIYLSGDRRTVPYAEMGLRLGLSEGAVKVAVHRFRNRYRELLRSEIAHTVSNPSDVEDEIRYLFSVLGG